MTLFFRIDSGSVNMVTFSSFLFIAVEGFAVTTRFGKLRSSVPLVVLYFVVSVLNNLALSYNISMPLHMIFKGVSKNQAITNSVFIK
jgi:UDP-xylose/UDP-N-acetylglucosamine transporter B4